MTRLAKFNFLWNCRFSGNKHDAGILSPRTKDIHEDIIVIGIL